MCEGLIGEFVVAICEFNELDCEFRRVILVFVFGSGL